ncbi:MAG: DUF4440 domain-containing protein [Parafilimonas terrae]|nr:DUF4440 domain-containing protein [Parafilimonas terrae]
MSEGEESQRLATLFNDAIAAAIESGDFRPLGALFADDAVILPPRARPFRGPDGAVNFWNNFSNRFSAVVLREDETKQHGDTLVRESGRLTLTPKDTAAQDATGKYLVLWSGHDGTWKIDSFAWSLSNGQGRERQNAVGAGSGGGPGAPRGGNRQGGYRQGGGAGQYGGGNAGRQGGGYRQGGNQGQGGGYRQGGNRGQGGGYGGQRGGIGGGAGISRAQGAGVGGGGAGVGGMGGGRQRRGGQGGPANRQQGAGGGAANLYDQNMGLYSGKDE